MQKSAPLQAPHDRSKSNIFVPFDAMGTWDELLLNPLI
jgi:hypothetical protein